MTGDKGLAREQTGEPLARLLGECLDLGARVGRARGPGGAFRSARQDRALAEIEGDLAGYAALLAARAGRTWWAGRLVPAAPAGQEIPDDGESLGLAIEGFLGSARAGMAETADGGDADGAGLLAELVRVGETWLWALEPPPPAVPAVRADAEHAFPSSRGHRMRLSRPFLLTLASCLVLGPAALPAQQASLPQQIADVMVQINGGVHTGFRFAHAKGIVLTGTFTPAPSAHTVSRAAHLAGPAVPVTVRLSDGTGVPQINDDNPNAAPRGMAIRFTLPKGGSTDIVANSHNGFFVGTGEDFLALLKAIAATTPTSPHPSPIEQFLGAHPRTLKVILDSRPLPKSFANLAFFGNNALTFVDSAGTRRVGRYQIVPVAGLATMDSAAAAKVAPDYLFGELHRRIAKGPIAWRLFLQLAAPGDQTSDGSIVWPNDRKRVELGTLKLTAIAPDNAALQQKLTFNPIFLTDGIQLADDPFIALRSAVYALSVSHRH